MKHVYTSAGIIKNADKPRVGVIGQYSVCSDLLDDIIRDGIDVAYESFRAELDSSGKTGYALTYNTDSGNLCVEYSRTTKPCHHTSPCYVMADGSGPCGDLNTAGNSVIAFCLPDDCLDKSRD